MKNKKHGHFNKPSKTETVISDAEAHSGEIIVNTEDQADLRALDDIASAKAKSLRDLQNKIGELELEKSVLIQKSQSLREETQTAYNRLMEKLKFAAHKKGIDADDPSKGKWIFDLKTMSFTKSP